MFWKSQRDVKQTTRSQRCNPNVSILLLPSNDICKIMPFLKLSTVTMGKCVGVMLKVWFSIHCHLSEAQSFVGLIGWPSKWRRVVAAMTSHLRQYYVISTACAYWVKATRLWCRRSPGQKIDGRSWVQTRYSPSQTGKPCQHSSKMGICFESGTDKAVKERDGLCIHRRRKV